MGIFAIRSEGNNVRICPSTSRICPSAANRNPEDAGRRRANKDTTAVKIKAQRDRGIEA